MIEMEKITFRTRLTIRILLWIASALWDGKYQHEISELVKEINEGIKGEK
tara:strand:+ start:785 stop:934 length:150 start_codon:yes stop_codon:yes gene_type:complete